MEAARKRSEIDKKMRVMLREIAYFLIFLLLLVYVCTGNQDKNVFYQNQDLRNAFGAKVNKVSKCILSDD